MSALFPLAMRAFHVLDRRVLSALPERHRTAAYDLAYRAKYRMFPGLRRRDADPDRFRAEPPRPRPVPPDAPAWLRSEVAALRREVDASLPPPGALKGADRHFRHPGLFRAGAAYVAAAASWPSDATHVLVVPWLKKGGADLVAIRHAEAIASVPGNRVAVVATERAESPWRDRLPAGASFVDLGTHLAGLTDAEAVAVLTRLLLQAPPDVLHVFPTRLGWKVLAAHGRALARSTRLYASSFCEDGHDPDGVPFGYADELLDAAAPHLSGVISDNAEHPRRLARTMGLPAGLFHVVPVPTDVAASAPAPSPGTPRVLWAGRLDWQKRPELLAEVAAAMPDVEFHVYGSKVLRTDAAALRRLDGLRNVTMAGPFDGFSSIPEAGWGCMLYTSRWDGLPNILLEAGARGFPVVASHVGGIGELVGPSTGWLVGEPTAEAHVRALRECLSDGASAAARGAALRRAVAGRHSPAALRHNLAAVPGYLGDDMAARGAAAA